MLNMGGKGSEGQSGLRIRASEVQDAEGISVIGLLREYVLGPEEAMKYRGPHGRREGYGELGNFAQFKWDSGYLIFHYKGTFVAYHNGLLIGQSSDGDLLYEQACKVYGLPDPFKSDRLTVFRVPENTEGDFLRDVEFRKAP